MLADFISKVKTGKINDEMTFNISSINSNGPLNMVPAEASLISEIRSMDDVVAKNFINDLDSLINKLCKSHNAYYDMIVEERVKAFKILTDSAIVQQILKVDKELGIFTRLKHSSGATDLSALYSILDIDGLVLTVGSQNEHSKNEILYIDKFLQCIDRLLALVMSYGQL